MNTTRRLSAWFWAAFGTIAHASSAWAAPDETDETDGPDQTEESQRCEAVDDARLYEMVEAVAAQPLPAPRRWPAWDKRRTPARLDAIRGLAQLRAEDERILRQSGLAVLASGAPNSLAKSAERLPATNPALAYATLYTEDLPIFVTMESLFWAVAVGHQALLERVENDRILPDARAILETMHRSLPKLAARHALPIRRDVDLYLTVARSLITGAVVDGQFADQRAAIAALVAQLKQPEAGLVRVTLFGRERAIDASGYKPRGAYVGDPAREDAFRALTWLTRMEFNLVSRDCRSSHPSDVDVDPSETPREAEVATALAWLADASGAGARLDALSRALDQLVARRADPSAADLLRTYPRTPFVHADLAAAIGDRFERSAPTHPMPTVPRQPVVWTLLGLRPTESTSTSALLLTPAIPGRIALTGADMAVALGHPRARVHLRTEVEEFPELAPALAFAPVAFRATAHPGTLRHAWLEAIVALGEKPRAPKGGTLPSFMRTAAYDDFRINTALAAYARLRRNHVAYEAQAFTQGGCDVPDGFVEPAPATLARLVAYAKFGRALAPTLDPDGRLGVDDYFGRLARVFDALSHIVQRELVGAPLSVAERTFLHQIVEKTENIYTNEVHFDGWFMDLFFTRDRPASARPSANVRTPATPDAPFARAPMPAGVVSNVPEGLADPDIVVDIATALDYAGAVSHLGTSPTHWVVVVVDTGGPPRALIGPTSLAYAAPRRFPERLNDADARTLTVADRLAPWTVTFAPWYTRQPAPWPDASVEASCSENPDVQCVDVLVTFKSEGAVGPIEIRLVDGKGRVLGQRSATIGKGEETLRFASPRRARAVSKAPDEEVLTLGQSVQDVILRRGPEEWRFGIGTIGTIEGGGFPQTLTFGPEGLIDPFDGSPEP